MQEVLAPNISEMQHSTQLNPVKIKKRDPTQPINPWVNPTHGQRCIGLISCIFAIDWNLLAKSTANLK